MLSRSPHSYLEFFTSTPDLLCRSPLLSWDSFWGVFMYGMKIFWGHARACVPGKSGHDKRHYATVLRAMKQTSTIIDLVRERACSSPHAHAYTFLASNGTESRVLNYHDIESRARAIGAVLQESCGNSLNAASEFPPRVLLLYPPGLEFIEAFYGSVFSGCIAVPASPPDSTRMERTLPRFLSILEDSGASIILTTSAQQTVMDRLVAKAPILPKHSQS